MGLGHVISDLLRVGIQVALPLSEHLPFDLIAISEDGQLKRVQVKYRAVTPRGGIECKLGSSWADRNGNHHNPFDPHACDAFAIFCPDPQLCCYLRVDELPAGTVKLRTTPPQKYSGGGVCRMAADYTDPRRIFLASLAQWIEQPVSTRQDRGSSP